MSENCTETLEESMEKEHKRHPPTGKWKTLNWTKAGEDWVSRAEAEARLRWYERLDTMTGCHCEVCNKLRERGRS